MKLGPGLTFSWKRALGVTKLKRSISNSAEFEQEFMKFMKPTTDVQTTILRRG